MASEEFSEESEAKRPTSKSRSILEKLLLEACSKQCKRVRSLEYRNGRRRVDLLDL